MNQVLQGKKVCILHPGNPRFDFRLKKTVKMLASQGAEVSVLAYLSFPENDILDWEGCRSICRPRPYTTLKASENKIWLLRVLWNLTVLRIQTLFDRGVGCCKGLAKIAAATDADWFHCINLEGSSEFNKLAKLTDKPIVYESYEYFPAELKGGSYLFSDKADKLYEAEKELVSKHAAGLIVVGEEIAQGYTEHYGGPQPLVVHNIALKKVDEIKKTGARVEFYFQSYLRPTYNIEGLIDAFDRTKGDARLTIQGDAIERDYLLRLQAKIDSALRRDDIQLRAACPQDLVIESAHAFDVGMISVSAYIDGTISDSVRFALPNKLFSYTSAGLALALSDYPAQKRILDGYNLARTFSPDSVDDIARALQYFIDNRELIDSMKEESLRFAEKYSFENESAKLGAYCSNLLRTTHDAS